MLKFDEQKQLDSVNGALALRGRIEEIVDAICAEGYKDICWLGIGGTWASALQAEVHMKEKSAIELFSENAAEYVTTGNKRVGTLCKEFKEAFGSTLRVYNGAKFADENATLASIRKGDAKGGELAVRGNMQVGNFENKVKELYGITVQVANADNSKLADNSITIAAAGKE